MSSQPAAALAAETPERLAFYERISQHHLTPLWRSLARLVTPEPASGCQPAAWSFADIRAAMIEAGSLITAQEAERRVLILENPGLRGQSKITRSRRSSSSCPKASQPPRIDRLTPPSSWPWKAAAARESGRTSWSSGSRATSSSSRAGNR